MAPDPPPHLEAFVHGHPHEHTASFGHEDDSEVAHSRERPEPAHVGPSERQLAGVHRDEAHQGLQQR
jgi:hypothetical protein